MAMCLSASFTSPKILLLTVLEPSFVLYALLLDPGCCLRAHIILIELVEPERKKKLLLTVLSQGIGSPNPFQNLKPSLLQSLPQWVSMCNCLR